MIERDRAGTETAELLGFGAARSRSKGGGECWNSSYIFTGVRGFESHPLRQFLISLLLIRFRTSELIGARWHEFQSQGISVGCFR